MIFNFKTPKGVVKLLKTFNIPAEVYLDRNELLVVTRKSDADRTHFLLSLIGLHWKFHVDGSLPWYKNRVKKVKLWM